jgi:hypothetical protein
MDAHQVATGALDFFSDLLIGWGQRTFGMHFHPRGMGGSIGRSRSGFLPMEAVMIRTAWLLGGILLVAMTVAVRADEGKPAVHGTPSVDERLVGTWRPVDPETMEFVPLDVSDIVITGVEFRMGAALKLPNSPDCAVYVGEGKIGQTCKSGDMEVLFHYAFNQAHDRLYIHGQPNPTPQTEGVAIYRRLK